MKKLLALALLILFTTAFAPFNGLGGRGWNTSYGQGSEGYCPWVNGHGWDGHLTNPTDSTLDIPRYRQFKPSHRAIDINLPIGSPIYAAEDGVVVWNGTSRYGGGIMVKLSHGNTWFTSYVHLGGTVVSCGQYVYPGQLIGYSGQTGTSWPHLHFSVNQGNSSYDPCDWLSCNLLQSEHTEPRNNTSNIFGGRK